jgi:hypothetical protein
MRYAFASLAMAALLLPAAAPAQELDVTRRTYTFTDSRLAIAVLAQAPGELQIVRGERGRVEVAARSQDGFAGFGLGGRITRELRLTAVGSAAVRYLVVVPEHVSVRISLPSGATASLPARAPIATYRWGDESAAGFPSSAQGGATGAGDDAADLLRTTSAGLFISHVDRWAPSTVNVADLGSVRSLVVRFEPGEFRIATSRPLSVQPGARDRINLHIDGEPLDLVLYVPPGNAAFTLIAGGTRIAESSGGRPRALCGNVVIQRPTDHQLWLTFRPQGGRLDCR